MPTFRGSCLCGEVAFEVAGPFDRFLNCHCSRCRKASGTAHSCEVIVQASALRWLRGEASVVRFDLSHARSFATAFCRTCGSPMPHLTRSGREAIVLPEVLTNHLAPPPTDMLIGHRVPTGTFMAMDCWCRTNAFAEPPLTPSLPARCIDPRFRQGGAGLSALAVDRLSSKCLGGADRPEARSGLIHVDRFYWGRGP
jgi:hypothetical protein